jgi:hypothetical protein
MATWEAKETGADRQVARSQLTGSGCEQGPGKAGGPKPARWRDATHRVYQHPGTPLCG